MPYFGYAASAHSAIHNPRPGYLPKVTFSAVCDSNHIFCAETAKTVVKLRLR